MAKKTKKKKRSGVQVRRPYKKSAGLTPLKLFLGVLVFLFLGFIFLAKINQPDLPSEKNVTSNENYQEAFIQDLLPKAQELHEAYGILPSIILGQAILESDFGQSRLASEYHNLFGIKAGEKQKKVHLETQEYVDGQWVTITADFAVFSSNSEALEFHTKLFVNGTTWNPNQYETVLKATNYTDAAHALQSSGYATDPTYAKKIINVIESYHLMDYDTVTEESSV